MKILNSAPKLSLIIIIAAAVAALFIGKLSESNFMQVVLPVLAFFFSYKPKDTTGEILK